ncbi:MAG: hypothetical protein ABL925_03050 [Methylococcales bacterium]
MTISKYTAGGITLALLLSLTGAAEAAPKPKVSKLSYDSVRHELKVTGASKAGKVNLYDAVADQWLAEQVPVNGKFSFTLNNLPTTPCSIRVEGDGASVIAKLTKVPACLKGDLPPVCKIVTPSADKQINFGEKFSFLATATDPDKTALYYEWDFGGGAAVRPTTLSANDVVFDAHNNTVYNVSFSATDLTGRRCTDRIKVIVGTPPTAPAKVSEQPITKNGVDSNEYVVLPFTPFSMEFHDLSYFGMPQMYPINWLNSVVVKKGSIGGNKPALMNKSGDIKLQLSAASNPHDSVGNDSINSTSQNYPLGTLFKSATVQKSDWFDPCVYNGEKDRNGVATAKGQPVQPFGLSTPFTMASCIFGVVYEFKPDVANTWTAVDVKPDEGHPVYDSDFWAAKNKNAGYYKKASGIAMPGISKPYTANDPQAFNDFDVERSIFEANGLAMFPTDDKGRHNPYPLMRVEATLGGKAVASADAVVAVSTEFNCADCHTKGKIAADQTIYDKLKQAVENSSETVNPELVKFKPKLEKIPKFVTAEEVDAEHKNDRAVIEQAASINMAELHDFTYGFARAFNKPAPWVGEEGLFIIDDYNKGISATACGSYCHRSDPKVNQNWGPMSVGPEQIGFGTSCPEYANSLHNTHGRMLGSLNADFTGSIERDSISQSFKMADLTQKLDSQHPLLLEAKDAGTPDSSCLFCHQGKQDKYQRDVMTAAGVNCIDCHGDMAVVAGGTAMASRAAGENPPDNNGTKSFEHLVRHNYRDSLPSCASCHTGTGDEPVLRRSYDMTTGTFKNLAAKSERFAENLTPKLADGVLEDNSSKLVEVTENGKSCPPGTFTDTLSPGKHICERGLFKLSLDRHGLLPCASCHGPAHSIWPNPDPYANDNVTAMQLQGHTGTILECTACHTADAFKDGIVDGVRYGVGILAGPHNMHPVNDPYWVNKNGGFHNQWAKKPGLNGEDQCATCHGKDHTGTRLSKTPVDRVFTTGKTKKFKKVTVKAGTQIGCDLCHSLEQSFKK